MRLALNPRQHAFDVVQASDETRPQVEAGRPKWLSRSGRPVQDS
jgi:hypothetical protein